MTYQLTSLWADWRHHDSRLLNLMAFAALFKIHKEWGAETKNFSTHTIADLLTYGWRLACIKNFRGQPLIEGDTHFVRATAFGAYYIEQFADRYPAICKGV